MSMFWTSLALQKMELASVHMGAETTKPAPVQVVGSIPTNYDILNSLSWSWSVNGLRGHQLNHKCIRPVHVYQLHFVRLLPDYKSLNMIVYSKFMFSKFSFLSLISFKICWKVGFSLVGIESRCCLIAHSRHLNTAVYTLLSTYT